MAIDLKTAATELRTNLDKVGANDRSFVESILRAYFEGRSSEKQEHYILVKHERWLTPKAAPVTASVPMPRITNLFRLARSNQVEEPRIRLTLPDDAGRIILRHGVGRDGVARIYINDRDRRREWQGKMKAVNYGAIDYEKAAFAPNPYAVANTIAPLVLKTLELFESDPHKVGSMEGHATKHCCFCGLKLKTAASVHAGYGPICAEKFGLPWGEGDAAENLAAALAEADESAVYDCDGGDISEATSLTA